MEPVIFDNIQNLDPTIEISTNPAPDLIREKDQIEIIEFFKKRKILVGQKDIFCKAFIRRYVCNHDVIMLRNKIAYTVQRFLWSSIDTNCKLLFSECVFSGFMKVTNVWKACFLNIKNNGFLLISS